MSSPVRHVHSWCMFITLGSVGLTYCKMCLTGLNNKNVFHFTRPSFFLPFLLFLFSFLCWMYLDVNDVALYCKLRNSQNVTANFTSGRWALCFVVFFFCLGGWRTKSCLNVWKYSDWTQCLLYTQLYGSAFFFFLMLLLSFLFNDRN